MLSPSGSAGPGKRLEEEGSQGRWVGAGGPGEPPASRPHTQVQLPGEPVERLPCGVRQADNGPLCLHRWWRGEDIVLRDTFPPRLAAGIPAQDTWHSAVPDA